MYVSCELNVACCERTVPVSELSTCTVWVIFGFARVVDKRRASNCSVRMASDGVGGRLCVVSVELTHCV